MILTIRIWNYKNHGNCFTLLIAPARPDQSQILICALNIIVHPFGIFFFFQSDVGFHFPRPCRNFKLKIRSLPFISQMSSLISSGIWPFVWIAFIAQKLFPSLFWTQFTMASNISFVHIIDNKLYYCELLQNTYFKLKCSPYLPNQIS